MKRAALLALFISTGAGAQVGPAYVSEWRLRPAPSKATFWDAQTARVDAALATLKPQNPARRDTYIVAVAAGGAQPLFDHEAKVARDVLSNYFGETGHTVVLSNRQPDANVPLATPSNLAQVIRGVARVLDPAQDQLVLYLSAHGSPDAALETNLPGPLPLPSINAAGLAQMLDRAGIKRRIVLISACFAGSWIPALASKTTIIMAAARRDRTSFGREMDRQMTYFGEALLEHALKPDVPLSAAFATAKRSIAAREAKEYLTPPSEPQASVGRDMVVLWGATSAASTLVPRSSHPRP